MVAKRVDYLDFSYRKIREGEREVYKDKAGLGHICRATLLIALHPAWPSTRCNIPIMTFQSQEVTLNTSEHPRSFQAF